MKLDMQQAEEIKLPFSKRFKDEYGRDNITTFIIDSLNAGASPYSIIENLAKRIKEQQGKIMGYALSNKAQIPPVYINYESLPDKIKAKLNDL